MKKIKKSFSMHDDYHAEEIAADVFEDAAPEEEDAGAPLELSEQMDQVVQGLSGLRTGGQVYLIDVRQLEPYPDQPF